MWISPSGGRPSGLRRPRHARRRPESSAGSIRWRAPGSRRRRAGRSSRAGSVETSFHFVGAQIVQADVFQSLAPATPAQTIGGVYDELIRSEPGAVRAFVSDAQFWDVGTQADYWRTSLAFMRAERRRHGPRSGACGSARRRASRDRFCGTMSRSARTPRSTNASSPTASAFSPARPTGDRCSCGRRERSGGRIAARRFRFSTTLSDSQRRIPLKTDGQF